MRLKKWEQFLVGEQSKQEQSVKKSSDGKEENSTKEAPAPAENSDCKDWICHGVSAETRRKWFGELAVKT